MYALINIQRESDNTEEMKNNNERSYTRCILWGLSGLFMFSIAFCGNVSAAVAVGQSYFIEAHYQAAGPWSLTELDGFHIGLSGTKLIISDNTGLSFKQGIGDVVSNAVMMSQSGGGRMQAGGYRVQGPQLLRGNEDWT